MNEERPRVIVIAALGVRDIRYKPEEPEEGGCFYNPGVASDAKELSGLLDCDNNLRAISQELYERYKKDKAGRTARLRFPILRPALTWVLKEAGTIDKLLLVVTNQDDHVPQRVRDTVFCGDLLELLVRDHWKENQIGDIKGRFVEIEKNPQLPDAVYELVRGKLVELENTHDGAHLYVLTSPGIPSIKDSLRHAGMNLFGKRCKVVQVDEPPTVDDGAAEGEVRTVALHPYIKDTVRRGAQVLAERDDFAGALAMLDDFGTKEWPPALFPLLEHAGARVNLDLHAAGARARDVRDRTKAGSDLVNDQPTREYLCKLRGPATDPFGRVNEIRFLIEMALRNERYADALFRIGLFRESCESIFCVAALGLDVPRYANRPLRIGAVPDLDERLSCNVATTHRDHWTLVSRRDRQIVFEFARGQTGGRPWTNATNSLEWAAFGPLGATAEQRDS